MEGIGALLATFLPLYVVLYLANVAERQRQREEPYQASMLFCYLLLGFGFGAAVVIGLLLQAVGFLIAAVPPDTAAGSPPGLEGLAFSLDSLPLLAIGVWLPGLVGLLLLLPAVRRGLARIIPIDPESPLHTVALSFTMLVVIQLMFTLGVGLGNLAELMEQADPEGGGQTILVIWVQQILMALMALVGVGWLVRRSMRASLVRLGVTALTLRQGLIGFGLGVGMVPVVMIISYLASLVGLGVDPDVERLTEQMIGPLFESPIGIITLGLAAALGEELLFRGAAQPRFGLVLTALLFALVHSNYGITVSTLIVFLLGLLLGWTRIRFNTSTAMVFHAVYNITLGVLASLSLSFLDF
jgi:uncharacterized protein